MNLVESHPTLGLALVTLTGVAFGFVLERAGFGRAEKLVAQFYGHDMTVFKVMFSAIVTAMVGLALLAGVGIIELGAVAAGAASSTYLWPMLAGGLLLGAGFVIAGYCPGTSLVAAASGNLDGLVTFAGVVAGTLVHAAGMGLWGRFHASGDLGQRFLWQHAPPAAVALGVAAMAVLCFVGAEALERASSRRRGQEAPASPRRARRAVFAGLVGAGALAVATLALPPPRDAAARGGAAAALAPAELARRLFEAPWTVRVVDVRARAACEAKRIPTSECIPRGQPLGRTAPGRELILVDEAAFAAWEAFARRSPALQGLPPPPPPPPSPAAAQPVVKKKGGGCSE